MLFVHKFVIVAYITKDSSPEFVALKLHNF